MKRIGTNKKILKIITFIVMIISLIFIFVEGVKKTNIHNNPVFLSNKANQDNLYHSKMMSMSANTSSVVYHYGDNTDHLFM